MNSTSTTSGRIMYVDAEVLYKALVETYVGRGRKDFAAVRVGKTRGAVIRSHEGLVARTRFPCRSVAPGVLLLPPMARDVLVGITGEVEVEYGGVGDRQRVRILHGGKRLLDHVVRDARLNNVSPEESRIPTGAPIHGPPLAFALHQADAFVDLANHPRDFQGPRVARLEHPERDAFRAPRADARQALEFANERLDGGRIGDALHGEVES